MSFDKEQYRKNREENKRGQGEKAKMKSDRIRITPSGMQKVTNKPLGRYAVKKNTKRARKMAARLEDSSY